MSDESVRSGQWYLARQGARYGPFSSRELSEHAQQNQIGRDDLVWGPGYLDWVPAATVAGLFEPPPLPTETPTVERAGDPEGTAVAEPPPTPPAAPSIDAAATPSPARRRSYVVRHWRGDLALPLSFWVNGFALNIALSLSLAMLGKVVEDHFEPISGLIWTIALWLVVIGVATWQAVGTWRSAGKHKARGGSGFWAVLTRIVIVLGVLGALGNVVRYAIPSILEHIDIAIGDPRIGRGSLRLLRDNTEIELAGGITFGEVDALEKMLATAPKVRVIHLNSQGGRILEARRLRDIIRSHGLITYTATECNSACTIAFLGGRERFVDRNARLGFHAPSYRGAPRSLADMASIEDREFLAQMGVPRAFVDRIYATPPSDLWYPSIAELRQAHIITGIADKNVFALTGIGAFNTPAKVEAILMKVSAYAAIRKADPAAFEEIKRDWLGGLERGATEAEARRQDARRHGARA